VKKTSIHLGEAILSCEAEGIVKVKPSQIWNDICALRGQNQEEEKDAKV